MLISRPLDDDNKVDEVTGKEHMILRDPSANSVYWHNTISSVPHTHPSLIIGHEFLDALPIQKFQYTKKGWREILVDLKEHVDWIEDDVLQSNPKGFSLDHASSPIPKDNTKRESSTTSSPAGHGDTSAATAATSSAGEPQFKEIICPHNNLAATAMLGGLFEGEQVEPASSEDENGMFYFKEHCIVHCNWE